MSSDDLTIEVHQRAEKGKNENRRLRGAGWVPGIVYGGGKDSVPIKIDRRRLLELLKEAGGENALFELKLSETGQSRHAMVRDIDVDPVSREIRHIDFQRILLTQKVRIEVPIELKGVSTGVKNEGGILDFVTRSVELECLPRDIPQAIEVNISELHIGQHIEVGELELPAKVTLMEEPDRVILSIAHPRLEEVEGEAEEELLEAEAEEPEVIRKGKAEEPETEESE
ncbi:MAG TPA: 50S ribosomal protein L25 [Thermoanaerobaculia bacterium]|nr:50S ribosomal protein L25 [Thermoanaerobaculia bacterium]